MDKQFIVGVDIGGTNTRVALAPLGQPNSILEHHTFKTPATEGPVHFLEMLEKGIQYTLQKSSLPREAVKGIGCALPGITNAHTGTALFVSNLRGWDGFHLAGELIQRFGVHAVVDNDVNAAALGEFRYGAGGGSHSLIYFTISTGIAAGIVLEGKVWRGFNHAAGELGFFIPDPEHINTDWHPNGCLELTSAGVGLARQWEDLNPNRNGPVSAIDVFDAVKEGDPRAVSIVERASNYLALSVVAICTLIDPECIVFSGSIAQHQPFLLDRCKEVAKLALPSVPHMVLSELHGDAPMIGALARISEELG